MTKHEFMTQFTNELHKRHIADAADVAEEYEQHFAFKMSDGYSEEEIAVKLPSTSPANAAVSADRLLQRWHDALAPYLSF